MDKNILFKQQSGQLTNEPNDNTKQYQFDEVGALADELVSEYKKSGMPNLRNWYCKLIHQFGPEDIKNWRESAKSGRNPAGLFNFLANQALNSQPGKSTEDKTSDKRIVISDEEMKQSDIDKSISDAFDAMEQTGHLPNTGHGLKNFND